MKSVVRFVIGVVAALVAAWWSLAIAFRLPAPAWLAEGAGIAFFVSLLAVLILVRPFRRALLVWGVALAVVVAWWTTIRPSNDRDWLPEVARAPTAEIDGDKLTVHNVRNFDYRSETDFTERWEDRTYDL